MKTGARESTMAQRRSNALLRLDMPQTTPLPDSVLALNQPVTHRFPGRG